MAIRLSNPRSRGRWFKLAFFSSILLGVIGFGAAVGAVLSSPLASAADAVPRSGDLEVPEWLWATLFAGAVQGLVWYGAINSKLTWIMTRLDTLETRFNQHIGHAHHREGDS